MTDADHTDSSDAGETRPDASAAPVHSVEVELTFDVDAQTPLPDWSGVLGVSSVGEPEHRQLDAGYFDTPDMDLATAGYAVRRRTGGADAGWHIKGPRVGHGRIEIGWPLGQDADEPVPLALCDEVASVTRGEPLHPIARILNDRTAHALLGADGGVVAEFVDDHVQATDVRTGVVRSWREWEIELGPAAPSDTALFFAAVEHAVLDAGGRPAASSSKLARALGH